MSVPSSVRVLIVDDDPDSLALLERTVRSLGFRVSAARDGETALRQALADPPDAVLLDLSVPGADGLEVCRRLRADARTALVPILLVTGSTDLESMLAGFEAGADDYVCKPFQPDELAARLRAKLELASSRSQLAELRGVFATIRLISHEFNNPLQFVVGGLDLLKMAREGGPFDEAEALAMMEEGSVRLTELARRLVNITEPCFKDSPIGAMLDIDASR